MEASTQIEENENPITYDFVCDFPDCGRSFSRIQGLSRHKTSTHGIISEAQKKKNGKKSNNELKRDDMLLVAQENEFGIPGILHMVFPNGIPPEKISKTVAWIEATKELMS